MRRLLLLALLAPLLAASPAFCQSSADAHEDLMDEIGSAGSLQDDARARDHLPATREESIVHDELGNVDPRTYDGHTSLSLGQEKAVFIEHCKTDKRDPRCIEAEPYLAKRAPTLDVLCKKNPLDKKCDNMRDEHFKKFERVEHQCRNGEMSKQCLMARAKNRDKTTSRSTKAVQSGAEF